MADEWDESDMMAPNAATVHVGHHPRASAKSYIIVPILEGAVAASL